MKCKMGGGVDLKVLIMASLGRGMLINARLFQVVWVYGCRLGSPPHPLITGSAVSAATFPSPYITRVICLKYLEATSISVAAKVGG